MDLQGKHVLVMGLGVHGGGLGTTQFLIEQGAEVTVTDLRSAAVLRPSLDALSGLPVRYVLGEHRDEDFRSCDLVIQNPGVPRDSRYLQIARAAGVRVETEMTLFFQRCPGPILGITGTKGKTTTTLLVGAMLREEYPDTVVAGNLRVSALGMLPRITATTPVVLELSSWQLEGLGEARVSPLFACATNISPDHLNRYQGMNDYIAAKRHIVQWQTRDGVAVLNRDDPALVAWAEQTAGAVIWFGAGRLGMVEGQRCGVFFDDVGLWWLDQVHAEKLCDVQDIPLLGRHNVSNVAAAAALARGFGVSFGAIRRAVRSFGGVEHRLEVVRTLGDVCYVNDTTATAPAAAMAALHCFESPIVLIAGGADKGLPFDEVALVVAQRVKRLVLLAGTATMAFATQVRSAIAQLRAAGRVPVLADDAFFGPFEDFEQAILMARSLADSGDVVLLSPGCASFGMFLNEFHRGEEFRRIVGAL